MKRSARNVLLLSALSVATTGLLAGCQQHTPPTDEPVPPPAGSASTGQAPAPTTTAYQPPTADQLYALVSPIALFPDKLVALTLAASTHSDDVDAARGFLEGNRNLTGSALIDAADGQPWDPSVKALVAFPGVVDQLATNADWTAALGAAYAAEPTDVMNAIQVMRERARAHGSLKDTAQQKVEVVDTAPAPTEVEEHRIVEAPAQTIEIEPAEPDVVYVPQYDPDVVYGEPVYSRVYTTERWYAPPVSRGDLVAAGLVSFGVGVLVGDLFAHAHHDHPWGWNAWNTSWGGPRGAPFSRPAVVYDHHPYAVNRTTVINHYTNIDRSVHIDNRHDIGNVDIHNHVHEGPGPVAPAGGPAQGPASRTDFAHMQRPNFSQAMMHPTAPDARPALPATPFHNAMAQPSAQRMAGNERPSVDPRTMQPSRSTVANAPHAQPPSGFRGPSSEMQRTQQPHVMQDAAAHQPPARTPSRPDERELPRQEPRAEQQHLPEHQAPRFEQHMPERQAPRVEPQRESRPPPRPQPSHHEEHREPSQHKDHDH